MGLTIGVNTQRLNCDFCYNETEDYYEYDTLMLYATKLGWRKNYITGTCTCPDCVKKQNEKLQ